MFDRNFTAGSILECFRNKGDEAKSTEKKHRFIKKNSFCFLSVYIMTIFWIYLKCKSVLTFDLIAITFPHSLALGYY